jgi:predicted ATPase with chaperone activity
MASPSYGRPEDQALPCRGLASAALEEASAQIQSRVNAARRRQQQRFAAEGPFCNAHMLQKHLHTYCRLDGGGRQVLEAAMHLVGLAIPRRAYTPSHIDYIIEVVAEVWKARERVRGFALIHEAPLLPHFSARLELR